ncbi:zinc finger protein 809-like [Cataglyphis hispanica]|uniref:zinc finger protein 809-like n=1 Tax=Cataglyphis hispanica TaxID=1086592 RepID=UPI00217FE16B|nr:zinc finger protein 809-like [Cataglyphis hispanica]
MDLSEEQISRDVHNHTLPQFSELRPVLNVSVSNENIQSPNNENAQSQIAQTSISKNLRNLTTKQIPDITSILDTCDLSFFSHVYENPVKQMINVPNFSNNILCLQPNSISSSILANIYSPSMSQANAATAAKQELDVQTREQINLNKESQIQLNQQQTLIMTDFIQKLQSTSLQQLLKLQTEQAKKQKVEQEKIEQTQNNILNIPSVRNLHQQSSNNFINSDQTMAVNLRNLNVQNQQQENESNLQTVLKIEQQVQTDLPKIRKKSKFRPKVGDIKESTNYDGIVFYCCPECNLGYPNRSDVEQHMQAHLQERKYQCKECGAMLKRKEHLDQHMRGHSDERPFKCSVCQKGFKRNEHLTRHCVIHSGNKNFICPICQKAFSRKDHLNKHIQTHLGIRKNKTKEDSYYINQKDTTRLFDNRTDPAMLKQATYIKDSLLIDESSFVQKNKILLQTISSFK